MKKIILVVILLGLITLSIKAVSYQVQTLKDQIGKPLEYQIKPNEIVDADSVNERFYLWSEPERKKMEKYLRDNKLKIKPGTYVINQYTPFKKAIRVFKFEKLDCAK